MFSGSWSWGEVQELDFDKDAILEMGENLICAK
jgi:hypothetical protein